MKLQDYIAYLEELTAFKKKHDGAYLILGKALAKAKTIIVPDDRLRELVKWLDGVNEHYVPEAVVAKARTLLNAKPTGQDLQIGSSPLLSTMDIAEMAADLLDAKDEIKRLEGLIASNAKPPTPVEIIDPNPCNVDPNAKELKMNTAEQLPDQTKGEGL